MLLPGQILTIQMCSVSGASVNVPIFKANQALELRQYQLQNCGVINCYYSSDAQAATV